MLRAETRAQRAAAGPNSLSASRAFPTSHSQTPRRKERCSSWCGGEVAALPLKGVIDLAAERARLAKEMAKCDADIARVDAKTRQRRFSSSGRPKTWSKASAKNASAAQTRKAKIAEALERLKGAA